MSDLKFLLDTNLVIRLVKAEAQAVALQRTVDFTFANISVSQITRIELMSFSPLSIEEERHTQDFLDQCVIFGIDDAVEAATIEFRRRTRAKLPDAIIAATAQVYGLRLLTFDDKLARITAT